MRATRGFTVTGPGVEKKVEARGAALSYAARRAELASEEVTFYVRDSKGESVGYAERIEGGIVITCETAPR